MALTSVRALFNGVWTTLTYNPETARYEGYLNPTITSAHQPGGYFPVTIEAVNDKGDMVTMDGEQVKSLRLVVRETIAPILTLVSPPQGYLGTQTPTIVVDIVDEEDGSWVNPSTIAVQINGIPASPDSLTYSRITRGYRAEYTPPEPIPDGPHIITFLASDYDGNENALPLQYTIDTVPPELMVLWPGFHRVVDDASVIIKGEAWDVTAPDVSVTITNNGETVETIKVFPERVFTSEVPLEIGANNIAVTATDGAGLTTTEDIYMIRLITDRTQADLDKLRALLMRHQSTWTESEREWFCRGLVKGAYNASDMNRVTLAVNFLNQCLRERGYNPDVRPIVLDHVEVIPKLDANGEPMLDDEGEVIVDHINEWSDETWVESDIPTVSMTRTYLDNVAALRDAQPIIAPEVPGSMQNLTFETANTIEKILTIIDTLFRFYRHFHSGEIYSGEF